MARTGNKEDNGRVLMGFVLTALWLMLIVMYLVWTNGLNGAWLKLVKLSFNELGDFLAGVFAPLAFFWLALAVLIQRDELRQNRESLDMQSRELKLAVDEYKSQSASLKGTEELQRLQLAIADFNIGNQILMSLAVDFYRQCVSFDERHSNTIMDQEGSWDAKIITPGTTIFSEIHGLDPALHKKAIHKEMLEELAAAAQRQSQGDISAVFAVARKSIKFDRLRAALIDSSEIERVKNIQNSATVFVTTLESITLNLERMSSPAHLLRYLNSDHPGKLADCLRSLKA